MRMIAQVNRWLKETGEQPRLRAGRGYYYFDGDALGWYRSSVPVYRADDLTLAQWQEEYRSLKGEAR